MYLRYLYFVRTNAGSRRLCFSLRSVVTTYLVDLERTMLYRHKLPFLSGEARLIAIRLVRQPVLRIVSDIMHVLSDGRNAVGSLEQVKTILPRWRRLACL